MRKYFLYEFKKNLLLLMLFTLFSFVLYVTAIIPANFIIRHTIHYESGSVVLEAGNSLAVIPQVILMILCALVPILMFAFKMKRRQVNLFYSLPIRREKLYLAKALVGLILVLVPYTLAYWLGFAVTMAKDHIFDMVQFVPLYFASVPLAVLLFGINAFIFTRANVLLDGILFVIFFSCAGALTAGWIISAINSSLPLVYSVADYGDGPVIITKFQRIDTDFSFWFTYSPLTWLTTKYSWLIQGKGGWESANTYYAYEWTLWVLAAVLGVAAWLGLILTAKKEKAENAGRISDSWFGYRTMLPLYLVFSIGSTPFSFSMLVLPIIYTALAAGLFFAFRRGFHLKKCDFISLSAAFVTGIILMVILSSMQS